MNRERIDRYCSRRADEFSGLRMRDYEGVMRKNYADIFAACIPCPKGGTVLDMGTGAGFFSFILAGLGWRVTGVDFSAEMLENARKNADALGFPDISYRRMDAQALDFPDASFDAVVSRNVTWTLPDPAKAYGEMVRVLRPGGAVVNFDANYGKAFRRAEDKGEAPAHPTQTSGQLRERNEIAWSLDICRADRPFWDMKVLAGLGMRSFEIDMAIDRRICAGSTKESVYAGIPKDDAEPLFMICAR